MFDTGSSQKQLLKKGMGRYRMRLPGKDNPGGYCQQSGAVEDYRNKKKATGF